MAVRSNPITHQDGTAPEVAAPPPATAYDPGSETDALIRQYVERDPVTNEPVFRGTLYPVWSVVLNLRGSDYDWERVRQMFPELPLPALRAAERFWVLHPEEIREYVEE